MSLKKTLSILLVVLTLFSFLVLFIFTSNFRQFLSNTEFHTALNEARWSLETTKVLLEEYLLQKNPRVSRQLRIKFDTFKRDESFRNLEKWETEFPLVSSLLSKRTDLVYIVELLLAQEERDGIFLPDTTPQPDARVGLALPAPATQPDARVHEMAHALHADAVSQTFLTMHEISSYLIDLSVQSSHEISLDTIHFISALTLIILILLPFVLFTLIWFRNRVLTRIFQLDAAASRISAGDYSLKIFADGNDELSRLSQTFTVMQKSVQEHTTALANEKERFGTILLSIGDGVLATDTDGRVTLINPVAERLTGWTSAEAVGRPVTEVFRILKDPSREVQDNPVFRVLETGLVVNLANHTILVSRTGEEYQIADSASPIRVSGSAMEGVVLVFRDVSEHNRMQNLMIQSEKMLSVGGLAAGMAHEINNPLSGMLQSASVIETRLAGDLPANAQAAAAAGISLEGLRTYMEARGIFRMLVLLKESGVRIGKIVNNMLSFARKGSSQMSTHNLTELVDAALDLAATDYDLKKEYDFRKIVIERDYEPGIPPIPCDSGQIEQVVLNLLRNGSQAMHYAATNEPRFTVGVYADWTRQMACIEIGDNGPGMDEAVRHRVFEPFFTTKPVGEGTGLGLSVSYFIITENHHGEMEVVSSPGEGATFIIRIPFASTSNSTATQIVPQ